MMSEREYKTRGLLKDLHEIRVSLVDMGEVPGISKIHRRLIKDTGFMVAVTCYNMELKLAMKGVKNKDYKKKLKIFNHEYSYRITRLSKKYASRDWQDLKKDLTFKGL